MALRIIPAGTESPAIPPPLVIVYGGPDTGKTTLIQTASAHPVLLDCDHGTHRANFVRCDRVNVTSWEDVANISASDIPEGEALLIDTVGSLAIYAIQYLVRTQPKIAFNGALTQQGYGALKTLLHGWFRQLRATVRGPIILALHMAEETRGEETVVRVECPGSTKQLLYHIADVVGRVHVDEAFGGRRIDFRHLGASTFSKDPTGFGVVDVPFIDRNNLFLANLLAQRYTAVLEERHRLTGPLGDFWAALATASSPKEINALLLGMRGIYSAFPEAKAPVLRSQMLSAVAARARTVGLSWDTELKNYVLAPPEAEEHVAAAAAEDSSEQAQGQDNTVEPVSQEDPSSGPLFVG